MTDEFTNDNNNLNDSSINKAKLAAEEFEKQEKIRKLKEAAEEIKNHANKKREEIENEAYRCVESLLSDVDLNFRRSHSSRAFDSEFYPEEEEEEDQGYFTDSVVDFLMKLFKFFNFMDSEIGFDADSQAYVMAMEEKKQNLIAAIMKLIRDKAIELIRKILAKDLSFKERVEKEIKELWEKIKSGDLSEEEEAAILERLQTLENLKLRLQMFAVGWVIVMLSELLSVELKASVEIEVDEDKKEEKIPSKEKETTKEAYGKVEAKIEVTEKEMPKIIVPASILDRSSGVARPISLTPAERDLLPDFLRKGLPPIFKDDMKIENREAPKQSEVKQENKQAEPKPAEQPKEKKPEVRDDDIYKCRGDWTEVKNEDNNVTYGKGSGLPAHSSVADCEYDFTSGFSRDLENGPKQSSVKNVEGKVLSGVTNIKVDKYVEGQSVGKGPSD
ncbi:V-type ATP synthase subunit I domain-containing protein [Wolbachia endosymbiont of Ctenocephalides felis wCfeJ]|uniref:hypothetical protein n=1 Tax=Wolbachia endosymbiont of Ctenocephalides felis wCfeJ TaxID=2732594 RepID=UPI001446344F|nr:hypothetical protein [Wolbachia endosymbiont of Ctenocephalides felis wCfeJ]